MRKILAILLICAMLAGCGAEESPPAAETRPGDTAATESAPVREISYESSYDGETVITLSQGAMNAEGANSWSVFLSKDIVYYEYRETYDSGNPYGEGEDWERHTFEEAQNHLVLNITAPGAYRVTGAWPAGQIRVDLGEDAYDDPNAVVELILDGVDITCAVAPAILFQNVYECDGDWDADTAKPDVDTSAAGANLILMGENTVSGSHVAKIFKDKKGEKKLWKQDGAIYSYMSMNVYGPGALDLTADNEGMDTELHLTVNGGDIVIRSGNDGINTNEDGVSVTTINGGNLHILAGLGAEGDGIDSNGYLVINGGTVISAANPISDAGLDSDLGSYIHGGTVVALGSSMDWAESESGQVTINLQFSARQEGELRIVREDGTEVFSYDPVSDPVVGENARHYQGAIISCPAFREGDSYQVYIDETQMAYTGTDVMRGPGGFGGMPPGGNGQQPPEGFQSGWPGGMPEGQEPPEGMDGPWPGGDVPTMPEGQEPPGGFTGGGFEGREEPAEAKTLFFMQDRVNFFSGIAPAT